MTSTTLSFSTLSKNEQRKKILNQLAQLFPSTFTFKKKKPLKKGILDELLAHSEIKKLGYPKEILCQSLKWYVQSWGYLQAFESPKAYRVDLEGQKGETITEAECIYARNKLQYSQQKAKQELA